MIVENFELNPVSFIKNAIITFIIFIVKVIIAGIIFHTAMMKAGLTDEKSIGNYVKYFVYASSVMYILTFIYFMFKCRHVSMSKMNYKKFLFSSLLVPVVVIVHIGVLIASNFIQDIPEVGMIIYFLIWSGLGIIWMTGMLYTLSLTVAEKVTSCSV
jgi:hypothetical protein